MAKNHNKYRKDKPWDTEDIDHWKLDEWNPEHLKGNLLEESSFATLFPKYREKYLRDVWPVVTKCLEVRATYYADEFLFVFRLTALKESVCLTLTVVSCS